MTHLSSHITVIVVVVAMLAMTLTQFTITVSASSASASSAAAASSSSSSTTLFGGMMTQQCYNTFIVDGDYFNTSCLKALLSKTLSVGIIAGALLLKVPQMLNMYRAGSAAGLSLTALYQDVLTFTLSIAFNYLSASPLTTYAELVVILIQNVALCMMFWSYTHTPYTHRGVMLIVMCVVMCVSFICPSQYRELMFQITIPINAMSRLSQAWSNYSNGHTGQLALLTMIMQFAGSSARVFTSLQEQVEPVIFYGFVLGSVWNGILVAQIFWYWTATNTANATAAKQSRQSTRKKKQ